MFSLKQKKLNVMTHWIDLIETIASETDVLHADVDLEEAYGLIKPNLDAHIEEFHAVSDYFFSPEKFTHQDGFGESITSLYKKWRGEQTVSLTSIIVCLLDHLDIKDEDTAKPALMAGLLGDVPNRLPYHSNDHFRDVLCTSLCLGFLNNALAKDKREDVMSLEKSDILNLAIAACIHDFCHDGLSNVSAYGHMPFRLEQKAFNRAAPYLKMQGLSDEALEDIEVMVLMTDVTRSSDALSPARVLRNIYGKHYCEESFASDKAMFERLEDNKKTTLLAMFLEEADIFTSVGLSYDYAKLTTVFIAEETQVLTPDAKTLSGFIETVCKGLMATAAAEELFGKNFDKIASKAAKDVSMNLSYKDDV